MKPGYGLPPEQIQEGGVISDDVMAEIADQVESLPAKVKHSRKDWLQHVVEKQRELFQKELQ